MMSELVSEAGVNCLAKRLDEVCSDALPFGPMKLAPVWPRVRVEQVRTWCSNARHRIMTTTSEVVIMSRPA